MLDPLRMIPHNHRRCCLMLSTTAVLGLQVSIKISASKNRMPTIFDHWWVWNFFLEHALETSFFGNNHTCCFQSAEIYKPMKDLLLDKISLEGMEMSHPTNGIVKVKCQPTACFFNIQASKQLMGFSTRSKVCKVFLGIIAPGILPHSENSPRARSKETKHMWLLNIPTPPEMLPMRYTLEMFSLSVKKISLPKIWYEYHT